MTERKCKCDHAGYKFCLECANEFALNLPPHPDTARADAAERMLGHVLEIISGPARPAVFVDVPGLREWWDSNRKDIKRRILAQNLADADATAARLRAELAEMDGGGK